MINLGSNLKNGIFFTLTFGYCNNQYSQQRKRKKETTQCNLVLFRIKNAKI